MSKVTSMIFILLMELIVTIEIQILNDLRDKVFNIEYPRILEMFGINIDILLLGINDDYYNELRSTSSYFAKLLPSINQIKLNELHETLNIKDDAKDIKRLIFKGNKEMISIFWDIYILYKSAKKLEILLHNSCACNFG